MTTRALKSLLTEVRACTICEAALPHGVRPVLQVDDAARVLIVGQAPGRRVHESGIPFDDPSGDRLRQWLGVTREQFYDPSLIAILPMGFCYPGTGKSGDLPPRPECAPAWRDLWPEILALPHPSPRNQAWFKRNAWFEAELLPPLRKRVRSLLLS